MRLEYNFGYTANWWAPWELHRYIFKAFRIMEAIKFNEILQGGFLKWRAKYQMEGGGVAISSISLIFITIFIL